jgi:hypothetical protein
MDIQSSVLSEIFVLSPIHVPSWLTPVKPPTLAHGGISWLLYNGNSTGLLCVVDPWAELQLRGQIMEAYDSVALYLNDVATPVDSATVLPGDEQKRIPLHVPHGQLIHGVNRLHYKVTRLSGNVEPSRDLLVLYHLRVPANLDLVIPPDVVANGVSAARAAQGVEFRLSYITVEKYDIARLQIGNQSFTLEVSDPAKPVTKTLYLEDFKTVGDGRFEIDFVVTDQLGNSAISAAKTLDVHIARLDLLPPTVQGQSGNNFSPTQPEIRVLVPQGPLLPTDKLSVTWAGAIAVPAASYTSPQRLVSAGLEIAVPRSVLAYSLGKTVTVTYTVERNGVSTTSPPLTLNILPLPTTALNPPKIVEADANNFLDIVALGSKDAIIHALLHSLIEKDQQCWLSLEGEKADGTAHNRSPWTGHPAKVNDTWIRQGFWPHGVPNSYLKDLGHGSKLTIKYKVALNKSNLEAEAVVFPDRVYTIKAVKLVRPTLTNVLDDKGVEVLEAGFTVSTTLTLKGAASKGLQVEIFDGNGASAVSRGKATAEKDTGLWSLPITVPVGARRLFAQSLYHSTPVDSNVRILTVTTDVKPAITHAEDPKGNLIYDDGFIVDPTVTLTGTASKGQMVEIFEGATSKGSATADRVTGVWTKSVTGLIAFHRFTATAQYGGRLTSDPFRLTVVEKLLIDTAAMNLNGVKWLQNFGWPVREVPGNTGTRTARGGARPYQYQSMNSLIASVDSNGKVTGLKNGETQIRVSDATHQTALYNVRVSNVFMMVQASRNSTLRETMNWISSLGGSIHISYETYAQNLRSNFSDTVPIDAWVGLFDPVHAWLIDVRFNDYFTAYSETLDDGPYNHEAIAIAPT